MDFSGIDILGINTLNASLRVNGNSLTLNRTVVNNGNTPYTVLYTDYFIACDTSSSAITINLPAITGDIVAGFMIVVKDEGLNAITNNITIDPNGSDTIEGETTYTIDRNGQSLSIYNDGTNWFIF